MGTIDFNIIIVAMLLLTNSVVLAQSPAQWPTVGHDAQRTRRSTYKGPHGPVLANAWSFALQAYAYVPPPVIGGDGTIYLCDFPIVYAINNASGQQLWSYTLVGASMSSDLALGPGGKLYVSDQTALYCINTETGALLWTSPATPGSATVAPDGTVYVCSNRTLYSVDSNTGAVLWTYEPGGSSTCNGVPTLGLRGSLYLVYYYDSITGSALICVNTSVHTVVWQRDIAGSLTSVAVGADGSVFYAVEYFLNARDAFNGQLLWQYSGGSYISPQIAISANGTVFCASSNYNVYAVHGQLGILLWQYTANGYPALAMVAGDGTLYAPSSVPYVLPAERKPYLHVINGTTGLQMWNTSLDATLGYATVVGAPGYLYAVTDSNRLVAVTDGLPSPSPSPTPHGTPTVTTAPSFTPVPSVGAIPIIDVSAVLGTQRVCGDSSVVPSWLYGFGSGVPSTPDGRPLTNVAQPSNNTVVSYDMTATAHIVLQLDGNTFALQSITTTCQESDASEPGGELTRLFRYATPSDAMDAQGVAEGCCTSYNATSTGYVACTYSDSGCSSQPAACMRVSNVQSPVLSSPIPTCHEQETATRMPIPLQLQGHGNIIVDLSNGTSVNSARYPANQLFMDAHAIHIVTFGVAPLTAVNPEAYVIGRVMTYCVANVSARYASGSVISANLNVPALQMGDAGCIHASLGQQAGSTLQLQRGTVQGSDCVQMSGPAGVLWELSSWVSAPTDGPTSSAAALSSGALIGICIGVPVAVLLVGAGVFIMLRRRRKGGPPLTSSNADGPLARTGTEIALNPMSSVHTGDRRPV